MINCQQLETLFGEDWDVHFDSLLFTWSFFYLLANIFPFFHWSGAPHYTWYYCIWWFFNVLDTIFFFPSLLHLNQIFFSSCLQTCNSLTGWWLDAYSCGICDAKYVLHVLPCPACTPLCHILSLLRLSLSGLYQACTASWNSSSKTTIVVCKDKGNRAK